MRPVPAPPSSNPRLVPRLVRWSLGEAGYSKTKQPGALGEAALPVPHPGPRDPQGEIPRRVGVNRAPPFPPTPPRDSPFVFFVYFVVKLSPPCLRASVRESYPLRDPANPVNPV